MKQFRLFFSPWLLALLPAIITILAVPWSFNKHELNLLEIFKHQQNHSTYYYFHDFNHDGKSEQFSIGLNNPAAVPFFRFNYDESTVISQHNFKGKWLNYSNIKVADYDNNGLDEVYAFAYKDDSLFLHSVEPPMNNQEAHIKSRFISKISLFNKKEDWFAYTIACPDLNDDGFKEILFYVNASFSKRPRAVFAWDIHNDTLLNSPLSGFYICNLICCDADGNDKEEIYIANSSVNNYPDSSTTPYKDDQIWTLALNNKLEFLFQPVSIGGEYCQNVLIPIKNSTDILSTTSIKRNDERIFITDIYNYKGEKIKHIDSCYYKIIVPETIIANQYTDYFLMESEGFDFFTFNRDFEKEITYINDIPINRPNFFSIDLGHDGKLDFLVEDYKTKECYLCINGFKQTVEIDLPISNRRSISVGYFPNKPDQLYINNGNETHLYEFKENKWYFMKYLIWLLVYLFWVGFFIMVLRIQKKRLQKVYEMEREINELHMISLRNQLNPHFIFNILTTISALIYKEDKEEANNLLLRFSNLIRLSMNKAEKTKVPLSEEIDFVEGFLDVQKIRFSNHFDYRISYDQELVPQLFVPRMILQIHVENAIKHGLMPRNEGGMLEIIIKGSPEEFSVTIEDNGIGRERAKELKTGGTGIGIPLSEKIYQLFDKLHSRKIEQKIEDLYDENGQACGTRVFIRITSKE